MTNKDSFFQSLVPLLLYVCEDESEQTEEEDDDREMLTEQEKLSVYSKAVNLLVSLTLPLDCLVSTCTCGEPLNEQLLFLTCQGPIHTGRDARGEANQDVKIPQKQQQQHCPHCTHQHATCIRMGPGSIYLRRASSVDGA